MRGASRINLRPSVAEFVPVDININSTDEELVQFLDGRQAGDPTPQNVIITDVNPFNVEPWNFPENMLFLYNPGGRISPKGDWDRKTTRTGYWRQTGNCRIFASGCNSHWKTTLEFFNGKSPIGERTGWVIHEYHAEPSSLNGQNRSKDHSSLYRVFLQSDRCSIRSENYSAYADGLVGEDVDHMLPNLVEQEERESTNCSHNSQIVAEKYQGKSVLSRSSSNEPVSVNFSENLYDICDFSNGEYLELNDLYSPDTHASSDDSSIMSINSDECFDSVELLRNIGNDHGFGIQEELTKHDFNISAPVRSNQVLIVPSPPGSIITNSGLVIRESNASSCLDRTESTSTQHLPLPNDERKNVKASTSSKLYRGTHTSQGDGSNSVRKIAKIGKRYCCFVSF